MVKAINSPYSLLRFKALRISLRSLFFRIVSDQSLNIAQMIKEARLKAGLTQKELAEKMGITVSAVTKLETRKASPSVSTLERIAKAMGKNLKIEIE